MKTNQLKCTTHTVIEVINSSLVQTAKKVDAAPVHEVKLNKRSNLHTRLEQLAVKVMNFSMYRQRNYVYENELNNTMQMVDNENKSHMKSHT